MNSPLGLIAASSPVAHIDTGDTGFVLVSAALVMIMTPGLAFFYGGLVRRKNFLAIMMQSFISMGVVTTIWVLVAWALGPNHPSGSSLRVSRDVCDHHPCAHNRGIR